MLKTDKTILKSIKNPYARNYTIKHYVPEITFEGSDKKPDFGELRIEFVPNEYLIELKSLKYYFYQFRGKRCSYERFINVVFDDIDEIYDPIELKITFKTRPRGGISSYLEIEK